VLLGQKLRWRWYVPLKIKRRGVIAVLTRQAAGGLDEHTQV
jgi:hypothetical protein